MSDAAETKTEDKKAGGGKSAGMVGWLAALVVLALLAALAPATTLIIVIGILPTFATALGDNNGDRRATLAVGVPNIAGILPVLLQLWQGHGGHGIDAAFAILLEPINWLLLYGGAGFGTIVYNLLPRAISQFAVSRAEGGIEARRGYQRSLERSWGPTVRTDKKVDK